MKRIAVAAMIALRFALPAHAQESTEPFRIGFLTDVSGPNTSDDGEFSVKAARMAIADFGGKVLGRPIELLVGDHQNKADIGLAIARKWYDLEHVAAIMDVNNSAVALAVGNLTQEKNRTLLVTSASSADLTGKSCTPNLVHWLPDTYSTAHNIAATVTKARGASWYILAVDYAYGHSMQAEATKAVLENGGKVLGAARHPHGTTDFASYLLQAEGSGAKVLALASAASDMMTAVKQAREFQTKMRIVAIAVYIMDVQAVGLKDMAGIEFVDAFYWDMNEKSRAWSKRFFDQNGHMPTTPQVDAYHGMTHYLKAVQAAGTDAGDAVVKKMKELPIADATGTTGYVREDGRVIRDMYLFEVKSPAESKYPWDYYKVLATLPGDTAYRPLAQSECPLVKHAAQ